MSCMSVNADLIKMCVTQNKTRILVNADGSVKNWMIGVLVKMIVCGILVHVIVNVIRHVKLMNNLYTKNFSCE